MKLYYENDNKFVKILDIENEKYVYEEIHEIPCVDRIHHKNVIEINKEAKRIPNFIKYDCISILFVPWDDDFIEIIDKCNYGILILMSDAFEYECAG